MLQDKKIIGEHWVCATSNFRVHGNTGTGAQQFAGV